MQRHCRVFCFFYRAFARLVLCFNPGVGSNIVYPFVATTIPEDRLRAEERHPRLFIVSYDTDASREYVDICCMSQDVAFVCFRETRGGRGFRLEPHEKLADCDVRLYEYVFIVH
jgi:hypothetical protein